VQVTTDSNAEVREILSELLLMADDLPTVTTSTDAAVAQAWFVRTVDSLQAALILREHGMASVADPLLRAAMEHAVAMIWLRMLGDGALLALRRGHRRWASNVQRATEAANRAARSDGRNEWSVELDRVFEELAAQEIPDGSVEGEWRIDQRFRVARQFDLYVAWLSETGSSHATQISASPYLIADDNRYKLLRKPRSAGDTVELQCAAIALTAFAAMGDVMGSDVWRAHCERLHDRFVDALAEAKRAGLLDPPAAEAWPSR
jgi:hypothetical protein